MGSANNGLPEDQPARNEALAALRQDPGLHQLLPFFLEYGTDQVRDEVRAGG